MEKQFVVARPRDEAAAAAQQDETLVHLFPDTSTEIVESSGSRRTTRSHYRALGREGVATFHFTFAEDGNIGFEKVCDGNVWRKLEGSVRFEPSSKGTRVRIEMEGRTKTLVPEFTIKGPMQDQLAQMAKALKRRIESASG
ncbi:MAG: hypothetical protein ABFS46_16160 [Myxococcota bacterium]